MGDRNKDPADAKARHGEGRTPQRGNRSVTPAQDYLDGRERYVRRRYLEDQVGYVDLAAELGVSFNALRSWLDAHGLLRTQAEASAIRRERHHRSRAWVRKEICQRRGDGQEIAAIAEDMGLGYSTVFRALKQEGLTRQYGLEKPEKAPRGIARVEAKRRHVLELLKQNEPLYRIASNIGVGEATLRKWISRNAIQWDRRSTVTFTELQQTIIDLWNTTSLSRPDIARKLDCSLRPVNVALRKAGLVRPRPRSGRPVGSSKGMRTPAV